MHIETTSLSDFETIVTAYLKDYVARPTTPYVTGAMAFITGGYLFATSDYLNASFT